MCYGTHVGISSFLPLCGLPPQQHIHNTDQNPGTSIQQITGAQDPRVSDNHVLSATMVSSTRRPICTLSAQRKGQECAGFFSNTYRCSSCHNGVAKKGLQGSVEELQTGVTLLMYQCWLYRLLQQSKSRASPQPMPVPRSLTHPTGLETPRTSALCSMLGHPGFRQQQ